MSSHNTARSISVVLLITSVISLLVAPLLMPESYDWIKHTTSESGAQGIEGAWLARTGFSLYGLAVLLLVLNRDDWSIATRVIHFFFVLGMIGNAVFSSKPWITGLPFNEMEDTLHSLMSGLVGTAFTLGVLFVLFQRSTSNWLARLFDGFAVLVSISVTLVMFGGGENIAGLIQRIMFAVSYLWYAREMMININSIKMH